MKTPLTQLIERLEAIQDNAPHIQRSAYTKAINEAKELLEAERDAIECAWTGATLDWDGFDNAEEYFNSTYPKPEPQGDNDNN